MNGVATNSSNETNMLKKNMKLWKINHMFLINMFQKNNHHNLLASHLAGLS